MAWGDRVFENSFAGKLEGDTLNGTMKTGRGDNAVTGTRVE